MRPTGTRVKHRSASYSTGQMTLPTRVFPVASGLLDVDERHGAGCSWENAARRHASLVFEDDSGLSQQRVVRRT